MAIPRDALRYPAKRVLLNRTRLAYVHLRNLLTDAKRDRAAKVYGYVAVWLPEELITLFLEEGEVVNATTSADGERFTPIAISDAIGRVPTAAEYGSVCFHEAADELLDTIWATQVGTPMPWPRELRLEDADALLAFLYATMHDGALEVRLDGAVHYVMVAAGAPVRGYFSDQRPGDVKAHLKAIIGPASGAKHPVVRLWPRAEALPAQASPALVQAYRDLIAALQQRLQGANVPDAAELVDAARRGSLARYPFLERFSPRLPTVRDPVTDTATLTLALASWLTAALEAAGAHGVEPLRTVKELTMQRRHMFQAAGLFDALPWSPEW